MRHHLKVYVAVSISVEDLEGFPHLRRLINGLSGVFTYQPDSSDDEGGEFMPYTQLPPSLPP